MNPCYRLGLIYFRGKLNFLQYSFYSESTSTYSCICIRAQSNYNKYRNSFTHRASKMWNLQKNCLGIIHFRYWVDNQTRTSISFVLLNGGIPGGFCNSKFHMFVALQLRTVRTQGRRFFFSANVRKFS